MKDRGGVVVIRLFPTVRNPNYYGYVNYEGTHGFAVNPQSNLQLWLCIYNQKQILTAGLCRKIYRNFS